MTIWRPELDKWPGPKYQALAQALAEGIKSQILRPGDLLPPHRDLAEALGVTVGTVTRGYAEAQRRGLVRGEVGRGTFVAHGPRQEAILHAVIDRPAGLIDLSCNYPVYGFDPDLAGVLAKVATQMDRQILWQYQPPEGLFRHRVAGSAWLARHGLEVRPEEVTIAAGSQHAIAVILGLVARPGETVLAEALTFPNVKSLARLLGLKLEPVEIDEQGVVPTAFEAACRRGRVRALYAIPTVHNPTTATWPEDRRREIVRLARDHDVYIIEDDNYRQLDPEAPPPMASWDRERTFYLVGTAKALAAGLRVAYIAAPAGALTQLRHNIASTVMMVAPLNAELVAVMIEDGTADRVIRAKRAEAAARQDIVTRILGRHEPRRRPASYHFWLPLPEPWGPGEFAAQARSRGVSVVSAEVFAVGATPVPRAVRISPAAAPDRRTLERGLERIAELLASPLDRQPFLV